MAVEKVQLGPFVGGLNSFSDPTAIDDTEVSQLVNFEPDIDGSLVSRPPIVNLNVPIPGASLNVLGFYEADSGAKYLIASNRVDSTYYFTGDAWVLITSTFAASAMVQFRGDLWLVAPVGSTNPGGKWNLTTPFAADANMPKGGCAVVYKDRIWVGPGQDATSNGSRLYLSNLNAVWPATPNYFNVGPGDGQNIIDLAIYAESILIFKRSSTYRYAFSTDPTTGVVSRISDNVGALAKNCWTSYQNDIYVLFDNKVYQFTNYNYNQLNLKVPLIAENPLVSLTENASISVWSDRLFVQYYDRTYVYSLRTRAWTTWDSSVLEFQGRVWPIPGEQGLLPRAYTYSANASESKSLFFIQDAITDATEPIVCKVVTKNYDYLTPDSFKRLVSWGADLISKVNVTSKATPVDTSRQNVTWDQLKGGTSGDGGYLYKGVRRNKITNPSFEVNANVSAMLGIGASIASVTRATTNSGNIGPAFGAAFAAVTGTASPNMSGSYVLQWLEGTVNPGDYVGVGIRARRSGTGATHLRFTVQFYAGGTFISSVDSSWFPLSDDRLDNPASSAFQFTPNVQAPAGTTRSRVVVWFSKGNAVTPPDPNFQVHIDGWQADYGPSSDAVAASVAAYADGDTVVPLGQPSSWDSTPGLSSSVSYIYTYQNYGYTWGYLKANRATWDRLLDASVEVVDSVLTEGSGTGRRFIKFLKSLRFRQVGFTIEVTTNGDSTTAPVRLFNIVTRVAEKQDVSKRIS